MKLKQRALYLGAPIDETALAESVAAVVHDLGGNLPDENFFRDLAVSQGLDFATMALYQAVRAQVHNAEFVRQVEAQSVRPDASPAGMTLVLVPALFYREHPEVGANGQVIMDVAARLGFQTLRVPTLSMGNMSSNVEILRDTLRTLRGPLWLASLSRGGGEVRLLFDRYGDDPAVAGIRGWINICGLVCGTPIHDTKVRNAWERGKYRLTARLLGARYRDFLELDTSHPHWQRPLRIPPQCHIVNLVAMPLPSHIQTHLVKRYQALAALGPNDAMVACRAAILTGYTYPVWGCDHFFRGVQISAVVYRLLRWVRFHAQPGKQCVADREALLA